jgi:hypothetical protein
MKLPVKLKNEIKNIKLYEMPQLDSFILASQLNILIIFIIGNLLFKYFILPIVTIFFKLDTKLVLNKYNTFYKVSSYLTTHKDLYQTTSLILNNLAFTYKFYGETKKAHFIVLNCL